jgi:hypothetical protein
MIKEFRDFLFRGNIVEVAGSRLRRVCPTRSVATRNC